MRYRRRRWRPKAHLGTRVQERYRLRGSPFRARPPLVLRRPGVRASATYHPFIVLLHWASCRLARGSARAVVARESLVLRTIRQILSTHGAAVPPWSRTPPAATPSTSTGFAHPRHSTEPLPPRSLGNPTPDAPAGRRAMLRIPSTQGTGSMPKSAPAQRDHVAVRSLPRTPVGSTFFVRARTTQAGSVAPAAERHHVARAQASPRLARQQRLLVTALVWPPIGSPQSRRVVGVEPSPTISDRLRSHARMDARVSRSSSHQDPGRASGRHARAWPHPVPVPTASGGLATREADDRTARRVALTVTRSLPDWGASRREHRHSVGDVRTPLYAQPVARSFARPTAATTAPAAPTSAATFELRPPLQREAVHPAVDLGQLSEDVYQYIQRKVRIERERRGL
jgi:hypothetical protein